MAREEPKKVLKRAKRRWDSKENWHDLWQDAYEFTMPRRNPFEQTRPGTDKNTDRVFDSTPINSSQRFASRLQTELVPPFEQWFELEPGPAIADENKEQLQRFLHRAANLANQVFQSGTFNSAAHETFLDLGVGTGAMLVLEGDDMPVQFVSVPQHTIALEEDPFNRIRAVYRKFDMAARDVEEHWPDADLPEKVEKKAGDVDSEEDEVTLWEATYRAKRTETVRQIVEDPETGEEKPVEREISQTVWYYEVIDPKKDNKADKPQRIVERTYDTTPWAIARWSKNPGEVRGRGPILSALPDIKTLNKAKELTLKNASLAIASPLTVADDGVTNPSNIRIAPGALIPVARNEGGPNGPSIAPLETSRNFDVSQIVMDDLRMSIKKMLFDNPLPRPQGETPRSATEIVERMEQLAQDIGGSFGRIYLEFITPLVRRVLSILFEQGLLEADIPVENQMQVKLNVTSPLARKQKLSDVQNIIRWLQIVVQFGGPQGLAMSAKMEKVFDRLGTKFGVPPDLKRTDQERQQLMQQMAQMAQQAQVQAQRGGSGIEPGAAPPPIQGEEAA